MLLFASSYGPETLQAMTVAFDEAWTETQTTLGPRLRDEDALRLCLAERIMRAASTGERDPRRLALIALGGLNV